MPALTRRIQGQNGQAIVLVALIMIALFGFLGLAVDGGRVYIDRREQQIGADSAALATVDKFLTTLDISQAMQAGAAEYAANSRITASPSATWCTSPATQPPWPTCSTTITWPGDAHSLTLSFNDFRDKNKGVEFFATSSHQLPLAFMQVLGVGPMVSIGAVAATVTFDQSESPAILALGGNPCNGVSGSSLTVQGSNGLAVTVLGNIFSDGGIGTGNGVTVTDAGNVYEHCGSVPITNISNPGYNQTSPVAPIGVSYQDWASYPWSSNYYPTPTQSWPGSSGAVEVFPGTYSSDPHITSTGVCYLMAAGQYIFQAGFTSNAGMSSNEFRPPDEPEWSNMAERAGSAGTDDIQFWHNNADTCDGSFSVNNVTSSQSGGQPIFATSGGQLSVILTAGRQDVFYPGGGSAVTYIRESPPSMCRTTTLGAHDGLQVTVSNVPGAYWYNVYAYAGPCPSNNQTSQFGYIGSFCNGQATVQGCPQSITTSNSKTSGCPSLPAWTGTTPLTAGASQNSGTCSLGYVVSGVYDKTNVATPITALPTSPRQSQCNQPTRPLSPIGQGCPPPDSERCPTGVVGTSVSCISGEPNSTSGRNSPYTGDLANENYCADHSGSWTTCKGTVTPGAVHMDFGTASNSCLNQAGNGGVWVFGGRQYDFIAVYSTNSSCSGANPNSISGGAATSYVGTLYFPNTSISLSGSGQTVIAQQVIAQNVTIDGSSGVTIAYNPDYTPTPPAGRLVV